MYTVLLPACILAGFLHKKLKWHIKSLSLCPLQPRDKLHVRVKPTFEHRHLNSCRGQLVQINKKDVIKRLKAFNFIAFIFVGPA